MMKLAQPRSSKAGLFSSRSMLRQPQFAVSLSELSVHTALEQSALRTVHSTLLPAAASRYVRMSVCESPSALDRLPPPRAADTLSERLPESALVLHLAPLVATRAFGPSRRESPRAPATATASNASAARALLARDLGGSRGTVESPISGRSLKAEAPFAADSAPGCLGPNLDRSNVDFAKLHARDHRRLRMIESVDGMNIGFGKGVYKRSVFALLVRGLVTPSRA